MSTDVIFKTVVTINARDWGHFIDYLEKVEGASASHPTFAEGEDEVAPAGGRRTGYRKHTVTWPVYKKVKQLNAAEPHLQHQEIKDRLGIPHSRQTIGAIILGKYDDKFADVDEDNQPITAWARRVK